MQLGTQLQSNKRTMKRLLQAEYCGESSSWIRNHPENVRFLARFVRAGGKGDAWLAGFCEEKIVEGTLVTIQTEDDPLEILRMGTLFGTCLSEGDINAHAAVANAVDLNKRVVYVRNGARIIGRKLVAVVFQGDDDGAEKAVLVSYAVYGSLSGERGQGTPRTRRSLVEAVDGCCMAWARACGIEPAHRPEATPDKLVAKDGYLDPQYEWLTRARPPGTGL